MSVKKLDNISACVFDAYGTLFDFNSAVDRFSSDMEGKADKLNEIWRAKQLQYTWLHSLMGTYTDFWTLTNNALDFALETVELNKIGLSEKLMAAYCELKPYPEVITTLNQIKESGIKIAILSNGEPNMLDSAVKSAGLENLIDKTLSVDSIGIYKPHPSVYKYAVENLDCDSEKISFQSSNSWDAVGAAHFGFKVVWCNRSKQKIERLPASPDIIISDLSKLPEIIGAI
ncbi:MAG: haloacid dehalogenase type II [Rhodospirillaceae bacterium]|nr:haloacid dehalogenase type II [Rhodospirillaceae bacterium]